MHKIVLAAAALLLLAGPAQAVLQPDPSRFDLDNQVPGAVIEKSLTIRNHASTAAQFDLEVVRFHDEDVTITPSRLSLGPGESGAVHVAIRLAQDAAGGRHDLRITATEGVSQTAEGVGARSAIRIPIIFHVENLKVASLRVDDASSGMEGQTTAMVFNHLAQSATATLHVLVRDQAGQEVFRSQSESEALPPEEHRFLSVPIAALPGGAYTIEAWAEHEGGRSNSMMTGYTVGLKAVQVSPARVEPLGDGLYRLSADIANTGTVGFQVATSFHVRGPDGLQEIAAPSYTLDPAETVSASITARLDPGVHQIKAVAAWDGGGASSAATSYTASASDLPVPSGTMKVPWSYAIGVAGIAAGLAIALIRRRGSS